ncbi:MAG: hypothetical protein H6948_02085 [Zoogloeaceae bacterium]|nr:hypothetical protein [Zoogloeaceae bacterium]
MAFLRSLTFLTALLALPAHAAVVSFFGNGTITPPSGLIGHGAVNENPIHDQGGSPITHPYNAQLSSVYTELSSVDAFDFTTGDDIGHRGGAGFAASTPAGHGLSSLGVTADDSNPIWLSISGLVMDTGSATDYWFDTGTNVEHRVYRGGSFLFYEQTGPSVYEEIFGFNNVVLGVDIDWTAVFTSGPDQIVLNVLSADSWTGPSGTLPLVTIDMNASYANDPIKASGGTSEGPFGVWEVSGNTWTFEAIETGSSVPLPSTLWLLLAPVVWRRLRKPA